MSTHAPLHNVSDTSFNRWAIIIGLGLLALFVAVVVGPKLVSGTNKTVTATAAAADPYLNKGADEIYSLVIQGGEKRGIKSMNPLELKMLADVTTALRQNNVPIDEAIDANKFIDVLEDGTKHVTWVILYEDTGTSVLTQVLAFQVAYELNGALVDNTESRSKWPFERFIGYGLPSNGTFNSRTQ